jgi:integrase
MIDHFLTRYRPLLTLDTGGLLFPGRDGGCKHITALTAQIERTVRNHTGLVVNPHLFRHLAGKLSQQFDPGNYELSRQLLGHRSTDTTVTYYTGQDTAAAVARYDANILERARSLRGQVVGR